MGRFYLSKINHSARRVWVGRASLAFFCFLNNLSELRILTTFYLTKTDHRWVIFISLKTIKPAEPEDLADGSTAAAQCGVGPFPSRKKKGASLIQERVRNVTFKTSGVPEK